MARFSGNVGYGQTVNRGNGVYAEEIYFRQYYGDVISNSRMAHNDQTVNPELSTSNVISIVSDTYANEHFSAIRYVEWAGTRWKVTSVDIQSPRLLLRLGGVYNGPTGTAASNP